MKREHFFKVQGAIEALDALEEVTEQTPWHLPQNAL